MSAETITPAEKARLQELEADFEGCKRAFLQGGTILAEIQNTKLYKDAHKTFESYLKDRWGISARHAYRMMDSAEVVKNVTDRSQISPPQNIEQTRPLAKLPAEQQPVAWEKAQEIAAFTPGGLVWGCRRSAATALHRGASGRVWEEIHIGGKRVLWTSFSKGYKSVRENRR